MYIYFWKNFDDTIYDRSIVLFIELIDKIILGTKTVHMEGTGVMFVKVKCSNVA